MQESAADWTTNSEAVDRRIQQAATEYNAVEVGAVKGEDGKAVLVGVLAANRRLETAFFTQKSDVARLMRIEAEQKSAAVEQKYKVDSCQQKIGNRIATLQTELRKHHERLSNMRRLCITSRSQSQQIDGENVAAEEARILIKHTNNQLRNQLEGVRQRLMYARDKGEVLKMRLKGFEERKVELKNSQSELSSQVEKEKEALSKAKDEKSQLDEYEYELESKRYRLKADAKNGFRLGINIIDLSDWEKDKQKADSDKQEKEKQEAEMKRLRDEPKILVEADVQAEHLQKLFQAIATADVPDKRNASVKTMDDFATRFGKPSPGSGGKSYYLCKRITKQFTITA